MESGKNMISDSKLKEMYLEYSTIKTRALGGDRIKHTEAKRALLLKKKLNMYSEKLTKLGIIIS